MLSKYTPAVIVGQAIGDSLGMPFESVDESVHPLLDAWDGSYREGTWHKLPPGHWTDDTEMAVCLARSLITCGEYDPSVVAGSYLDWMRGTPHGMGGTTRSALENLATGVGCYASGIRDLKVVGNGTAMRVAPLGVMYWREGDFVLRHVAPLDARITHHDPDAEAGSYFVSMMVAEVLKAAVTDKRRALALIAREIISRMYETPIDESVPILGWKRTNTVGCLGITMAYFDNGLPIEQVMALLGRSGKVHETVGSALWCVLKARTFLEGLELAIRWGGDTDTRGAIVGAILGAYFGLEWIPADLVRGLLKSEELKQLDLDLFAAAGA